MVRACCTKARMGLRGWGVWLLVLVASVAYAGPKVQPIAFKVAYRHHITVWKFKGQIVSPKSKPPPLDVLAWRKFYWECEKPRFVHYPPKAFWVLDDGRLLLPDYYARRLLLYDRNSRPRLLHQFHGRPTAYVLSDGQRIYTWDFERIITFDMKGRELWKLQLKLKKDRLDFMLTRPDGFAAEVWRVNGSYRDVLIRGDEASLDPLGGIVIRIDLLSPRLPRDKQLCLSITEAGVPRGRVPSPVVDGDGNFYDLVELKKGYGIAVYDRAFHKKAVYKPTGPLWIVGPELGLRKGFLASLHVDVKHWPWIGQRSGSKVYPFFPDGVWDPVTKCLYATTVVYPNKWSDLGPADDTPIERPWIADAAGNIYTAMPDEPTLTYEIWKWPAPPALHQRPASHP